MKPVNINDVIELAYKSKQPLLIKDDNDDNDDLVVMRLSHYKVLKMQSELFFKAKLKGI